MKSKLFVIFLLVSIALPGCSPVMNATSKDSDTMPIVTVKLPDPVQSSEVSIEEALLNRRSGREYSQQPLTLAEVGQLLWSGQGITTDWGGRTAPSAGGLYPLEIYLVAGNVTDLAAGIYKYLPQGHELAKVRDDDLRIELSEASLGQSWVREGAIDIVIAAVYERTTQKYGSRGVRYADMEAGHAAQNICLQAAALDLELVTVGAFSDDEVKKILQMLSDESPLYVIPVGKKG